MRLGGKLRTTAWTEIPHSLKSQRKRCGGSPSLFPLAMLLQEGHFFLFKCGVSAGSSGVFLSTWARTRRAFRAVIAIPCTLHKTRGKTLWTGEAYLKSNQCKGGNAHIKSCTRDDDKSVCSNHLSNGKGKGRTREHFRKQFSCRKQMPCGENCTGLCHKVSSHSWKKAVPCP